MFDVTFNLSQRTKGVTQCLLLIINIHDLYIFTSNFFSSSSSAAGLFEADLERREPQVFFLLLMEAAALSLSFPLALKIGFLAKQS